MRLKGGKVLLDLSDWDFLSNKSIETDNDLTKAILFKGISVLLSAPNGFYLNIDLVVKTNADGQVIYYPLINDDGDEFEIKFEYMKNVNNVISGELSFTIQE